MICARHDTLGRVAVDVYLKRLADAISVVAELVANLVQVLLRTTEIELEADLYAGGKYDLSDEDLPGYPDVRVEPLELEL